MRWLDQLIDGGREFLASIELNEMVAKQKQSKQDSVL